MPSLIGDPIDATPYEADAADVRARATELLQAALGPDAAFRDGQLESIEALVAHHARLLVVQRTGWGKSSVYFLTTRLLRERGAGPTVLISPLLALMRDQIRAAERFGLTAATINSTNMDDWAEVTAQLHDGDIDVLLVSPERLANAAFRERVLAPLMGEIGLFVVDEAHCISDWGHDFRPDYRRIRGLLPLLPPHVAVLATTATANNDVVNDVVHQLGGAVDTVRGPLSRASLGLQATGPMSEAERLAWLAEHLPHIDGSGIVYVLTKAHAHRVAAFLRAHGVDAEAYTGGGAAGGVDERTKLELEQRLMANEIKAVVATPALGMGFDKPDLAFVIHYQMPQSLIHYYQQVGRAGRAVDSAIGVLLHGPGDRRITDYFIAQAFPPVATFDSVLRALGSAAPLGLTLPELAKRAHVGRALTEKVLGQLAVEARPPVVKDGSKWFATGEPFTVDEGHYQELTMRRLAERARMDEYAAGRECLMAFVARELDDPAAEPCGRCAVCVGHPLVSESVSPVLVAEAEEFSVAGASGGRTRKRRPRRPPSTTARTKRRKRRRKPPGGASSSST